MKQKHELPSEYTLVICCSSGCVEEFVYFWEVPKCLLFVWKYTDDINKIINKEIGRIWEEKTNICM